MTLHTDTQLGFDDLLADCEAANQKLAFERETDHLPDGLDDGLRYYRYLLDEHHTAMFSADVQTVRNIREDAYKLALKLNHGKHGILASEDAPGCMLDRLTAAPYNDLPQWGQSGDFIIDVDGVATRIKLRGIFGIGSRYLYWPGFEIYAVNRAKPFFSETGYRSFLGDYIDIYEGWTPDMYAAHVLRQYRKEVLNGKLKTIEQRYQQ